MCCDSFFFFFFSNDTAATEIYTLSLHDALPICARRHRERLTITLAPVGPQAPPALRSARLGGGRCAARGSLLWTTGTSCAGVNPSTMSPNTCPPCLQPLQWRSGGPPAARELSRQRQPDRPARLLRRGQALRRDPVLRLFPPAPAAHQGRPHLQHLWAAHAPQ